MDLLQVVTDLAKQSEELKNMKKELHDGSLEKARLSKEIKILKNTEKSERESYDKSKNEMEKEISQLTLTISGLQKKRTSLATDSIPEIKKLETLKAKNESLAIEIDRKNNDLETKINRLSKAQKNLDEKVIILAQIKKLFEKL